MQLYFIPYLLLSGILYFLYLNEAGKIKFFTSTTSIWIAYIILWIFIGLRGHIMSDFIIYYGYFNNCPNLFNLGDLNFKGLFEPGFILYTAIFKTFSTNYFAWIAFNTLIDLIVLAYVFRRYCQSMILPLIFFIAFNGLLIEFNLYRNIKAIDLFLLSLPYLEHRKIVPYMILNIIGVTFHSSALLFLPLYFVLTIQMPVWLMWGGFVVANVIYIFNIPIANTITDHISFLNGIKAYDKLMGYASHDAEFKFSIGFIERTLSFLLFTLLYKRLVALRYSNHIFYNCFWLYYCSFLILYEVSIFAERVPYLFMFSYWILYPAISDLKYRYRQYVNIGISILVLLKIINSYNNPPSQYENIMTGISDYQTRKKIQYKFLRDSK